MKKSTPDLIQYLKVIAEEIHENAIEKEFWDKPNPFEKLMLAVSELGEIIEADRINKRADLTAYHIAESKANGNWEEAFRAHVKDSFEDECADTIIRMIDWMKFHKCSFDLIRDYQPPDRIAASTNVGELCFYISGLLGLLNNATQNPSNVMPKALYFMFAFCWEKWQIDIVKFIHLKHRYNKTREKKHGKKY